MAFFLCLTTITAMTGCGAKSDAEKLVKLGDYKKLEVEVDKSYEVTDTTEKETIESYFLSAPIYTENKEKTVVEDGDVANIDYTGTKDGEEFEGGSAEGYNLEIGSGTFIEGFEEGLVGKKVGEETDLNLTFPEGYSNEELAGKAVVFHVKINSIQTKDYPTYDTLTDEYVEDNYSAYYGVKTVKELKNYVKDFLDSNYQTALGEAMTEELKKICEVGDIPDDLMEERTKELKNYYKGLAKSQDQEFEDFLQNNYGMSEDDFNEQIEELMPDYLESDLIWEAIAEKEGIEAKGTDYDKFLTEMMENLEFDTEKALFEVYPESMVKRMFIEQEAKEKLAESAKVTYVDSEAVEDTDAETDEDAEQTDENAEQTEEDEKTDEDASEETTDAKIDTTTGK